MDKKIHPEIKIQWRFPHHENVRLRCRVLEFFYSLHFDDAVPNINTGRSQTTKRISFEDGKVVVKNN
jgi:hypothetical protein